MAVIAVVVDGCGGDDREPKPATNSLEGFAMTRSDLPAGYKAEEQKRSSSPAACPIGFSSRSEKKKFASLGVRACAAASFRKDVAVSDDIGKFNAPKSEALAMRDEQAASAALRVIRATIVANSRGSAIDTEVHSLPAPGLGDEAPRGVSVNSGGYINAFIYIWRRGNVVAWMSSPTI
ncbi:MAG: hypothetical protein LC777_09645 [Actinobacteria bacterium]|nr:hypothetical protein [Actinomycetota bacterium]